ncbi:hypothetical protein COU54_01155 [Candidatus Pacearchaeota archaeon CG10_big_fil_rev_8_21_14_0_10_31_24]|nr:MAG: hypothetical protein COU54_01155 [Candidatus Pacearchaeota archaeon CG10_big_fil_rev_8_21_14_0_10_31_24]
MLGMTSKSIMIDVDDPKAAEIAEVVANSSCRKIIGLLAEDEMSENEIASKLGIPINTVGYNIKKLVKSGFIESTRKTLWSVKGKKVLRYRVSEKKIVISSKRKIKGILPAIFASAIGALGIKLFYGTKGIAYSSSQEFVANSVDSVSPPVVALEAGVSADRFVDAGSIVSSSGIELYWLWFFGGAIAFLMVLVLYNWRRIW